MGYYYTKKRTLNMELELPELKEIIKRLTQIECILNKLNPEVDQWIPSKDIPTLLNLSRKTWDRYRRDKLIPYSQHGNKIFVKRSDLDKFLESRLVGRRTQKGV